MQEHIDTRSYCYDIARQTDIRRAAISKLMDAISLDPRRILTGELMDKFLPDTFPRVWGNSHCHPRELAPIRNYFWKDRNFYFEKI